MRYILMNSDGKFEKEKKAKDKNKKIKEEPKDVTEEKENIDVDAKEVDIAEYNIKDDEISKELKKRTDIKLKEYLDVTAAPIPLTYTKFDTDMNAVVEGVLNDQDRKKKQNSKNRRLERMKALKDKLFNRRKDG